jgi:hypothetical protein
MAPRPALWKSFCLRASCCPSAALCDKDLAAVLQALEVSETAVANYIGIRHPSAVTRPVKMVHQLC